MVKPLGRLIVGLVLVIVVVIVAFQNRRAVHIRVLWWTLPHVALALVVLVSILIGVLLGMAAIGWAILQRRRAKPHDYSQTEEAVTLSTAAHGTTFEPAPEATSDPASQALTHNESSQDKAD
jgi:uncharacterized integral membrane protein